VHPTLEPAHIVLGIKETPLPELDLLTGPAPDTNAPRTHVMFSHTTKGQAYNMPLLSRFLAGHPAPSRQSHPALSRGYETKANY
jgi:alpha-aminoadipic semialdehyde synthase